MTEEIELTPVCEPGIDFTELVTVREIGIVARQIGADPMGEIEEAGAKRWEAMARLGWVLHRRRDPRAAVDPWLDCPLPKLLELLAIPDETERPADPDQDPENPTDSGRG